jgi:RNA polymerase sigma factor (sigma-70 family)
VNIPSTTQPSEATGHGQWFSENIQPHDASLKTYVRTSFPHLRDVEDIVQESYLRIWKARAAHPIQSGKAFLFTVARNVALNLMQRRRISPILPVADLVSLPVIDNEADIPETACSREEIALLADGIETLPARCREIFILRRIQGVPQKEIAARLGISVQTVQVQVQRGVKHCARFLRRRGVKREA